MNYIFESEGKSRAEAEKMVFDILGLGSDDLTFKTVNSGMGLLGLVSRKPVVVRAVPNHQIAPEIYIKAVLITLIKKMGFSIVVNSVGERDGNIYIEMDSPDSGIIIGKQGKTLDAIQFLINLLIEQKLRHGRRIMLDISGYRDRREKRLTRLARMIADKVSKSNQSVALDYMNPYERRIIHLALEEDARVYTKSEGNGLYKRVRVIPSDSIGNYAEEAEPEFEDEF
jgi:spoIIIJ-associated protein